MSFQIKDKDFNFSEFLVKTKKMCQTRDKSMQCMYIMLLFKVFFYFKVLFISKYGEPLIKTGTTCLSP